MSNQIFIIIFPVVILCILIYLMIKLKQIQKLINKQYTQLETSVQQKTNILFNQFEAYHYLKDRLKLDQGMPYTTHWSASPDFLKIIAEHCLEHKPETILECSSGLSTLILARCCQLNNKGKVHSLENGKEYAGRTRSHIKRYQNEDYASVIDAPLQSVTINNSDFQWYTLDKLPRTKIDMLVIDGPPGFIQKHSRYPALPLLFDKLADNCVIFLDDAQRIDEKEIVKQWITEFTGLQHDYISTERGCSVLRIDK